MHAMSLISSWVANDRDLNDIQSIKVQPKNAAGEDQSYRAVPQVLRYKITAGQDGNKEIQ